MDDFVGPTFCHRQRKNSESGRERELYEESRELISFSQFRAVSSVSLVSLSPLRTPRRKLKRISKFVEASFVLH